MTLPKVCYLSTGIMDSAFDSQVVPVMVTALESGFDLVHISFDPFRGKRTERYEEKKRELDFFGIRTLHVRQAPPIFRGSLAVDARRMHPFLRRGWERQERLLLHCRGHMNAYRGLLLKRENPELIRVIADLRGAVADEVCQTPGGVSKNPLFRYLRKFYQEIEKQVVQEADKILCVSNVFKEFLQSHYDVKEISIIPTFVDTARFTFSNSLRQLYRKKLGVSTEPVVVYSGGVAAWQRIEDVARLFSALRQTMENLFMLFLTQEPSRMKKEIGDLADLGHVRVIQVPHNEVAGYLCASDVGVLLREDRLTNHVAAPIKFSEYMCCGLPSIISDRVGDTAEVVRQGNAGIVLGPDKRFVTSHEFRKLLGVNREEISKGMGRIYSSEVYLPKVLRLYEALVNK